MICPICKKQELAPATLNKTHTWCQLCAQEFDAKGEQIKSKQRIVGADVGLLVGHNVGDQQRELIAQAEEFRKVQPYPGVGSSEIGQFSAGNKSFNVQIGEVSFVTQGRVELNIAGTKVVIT